MTMARARKRLGLLVPFTNTNFEPDMMLMCPAGLTLHIARMGGYEADEIPDETQMQGLGETDLGEPLRLLAGAKPDIVLYGCTSATLAHGVMFDQALSTRVGLSVGALTITAAGALAFALHQLKVGKIGFASPYVAAINDLAVSFLEQSGFTVAARADFGGILDNDGQGALTPDDVFDLGLQADGPDVEAVVLSCTDMRAVETIERLEQHLGKPVVTSNQALMFTALRRLGIEEPLPGFGRLLAATTPG